MTDPNANLAILNTSTPEAARALEQASSADRWWDYWRHQCDMFAQNHSWAEASAYLSDPRIRLRVAHARVLRGENLAGQDLSPEEPDDRPAAEAGFWAVPLRLQSWEAQHWNSHYLTHFHALGSGSSGLVGFPPEHLDSPILLHAKPFHDRVAPVETLGEWELSSWIEWVATMNGTAEQAAAHHLAAGACGHPKDTAQAAAIDFAQAYPALLTIFGGAAAYGGRVSESLGRLQVWRLLSVMTGSTAIEDIAGFIARSRCITWHDPCDEIWYLHLAIEDPNRHRSWVLDGQDFD